MKTEGGGLRKVCLLILFPPSVHHFLLQVVAGDFLALIFPFSVGD